MLKPTEMAAGQEAEQKPWGAALPVDAQSHLSILALSPVATEGTVLSCALQDSWQSADSAGDTAPSD